MSAILELRAGIDPLAADKYTSALISWSLSSAATAAAATVTIYYTTDVHCVPYGTPPASSAAPTWTRLSLNNSSGSFRVPEGTLKSNTLYFFRAVANDDGTAVSSTYGATYGATTTHYTTPLDPHIDSLTTIMTRTDAITIQWTGEFHTVYVYYRQNSGNTVYLSAGDPVYGVSEFTLTSLNPGFSYQIFVVPYDMLNVAGAPSSTIIVSTNYTPTVTTFEVASVTSTTATFAVAGNFAHLQIQKTADLASNSWSVVADLDLSASTETDGGANSASFTLSSLSPATTYYYLVVPYDQNMYAGTAAAPIEVITTI